MFSLINVRTKSRSTWYLYSQSCICYQFYKDDNKFKTQSKQEIQEYETVVFQKNRYKILTYTNPFEQNNDHTRISHEIEFRSSFKSFVGKYLTFYSKGVS